MKLFAVKEIDQIIIAAVLQQLFFDYYWIAEVGNPEKRASQRRLSVHIRSEQRRIHEHRHLIYFALSITFFPSYRAGK